MHDTPNRHARHRRNPPAAPPRAGTTALPDGCDETLEEITRALCDGVVLAH